MIAYTVLFDAILYCIPFHGWMLMASFYILVALCCPVAVDDGHTSIEEAIHIYSIKRPFEPTLNTIYISKKQETIRTPHALAQNDDQSASKSVHCTFCGKNKGDKESNNIGKNKNKLYKNNKYIYKYNNATITLYRERASFRLSYNIFFKPSITLIYTGTPLTLYCV